VALNEWPLVKPEKKPPLHTVVISDRGEIRS